ncbi:MAG: hypothetical protein JKY94_09185 [Rhodobacteraceae bacterium]|nr:hypothetical protein [Paracoccaceae bacterium]
MFDFARMLSIDMRSLVKCVGDQEAAAAFINMRWGTNTSKSIICRKLNGSLSWGVLEAMALEDVVGKSPVTDMMHGRFDTESTPACVNLFDQSGVVAKENGEALAATLAAAQSGSPDDKIKAIVEINQTIQALIILRTNLEAGPSK